ncbi:nucleic-acid-binding protein from transposon X-element [Trichonephila clavipes]|nr:nucleic-acid-binding protein from transposon X-element [Trichonephila clavipes]
MTEILDLTPAMDLDTELTNGMDNNDDRHPMENEPPLPQDDSRPGTPHLTNCEQMKILARNIKYYTITIENIKANIRSLKLHGLNDEDCHIMKEHLQRLDNYTALNALTVSEFSSLPSCDNPACAEHHTPLNTPTKNNDNESPTLPKTASLKRKDNESEFASPPNRKLFKNQNTPLVTEQNFKINLSNKFNALEIHDSEIDPVEGTSTATSVNNANAVNNKKKTTTNATVNKSADLTKNLPPPVVIKGLPKKAKPEDIEKDLIDLGFTVDRVSQLIGKITNQPLPVFLVSLPRNMTNANIFKLDKLSFLNVTVEGYDSKGVTQCYKCQQFNHTASNCHIKPKCLKCGEPHQTSECEIDRVETMYCVNCEAYGHMANYSKCPLYPKPRKGATIKPNYTTIVNSLVRPNVSFAQAAAQQEKNKNTAPTPQQMAPRIGQVPTTITAQTQAATTHIAKQQKTSNAKNECMGLITQTLTQTIQALSLLVQQINSIDFSSNTHQPSIPIKINLNERRKYAP